MRIQINITVWVKLTCKWTKWFFPIDYFSISSLKLVNLCAWIFSCSIEYTFCTYRIIFFSYSSYNEKKISQFHFNLNLTCLIPEPITKNRMSFQTFVNKLYAGVTGSFWRNLTVSISSRNLHFQSIFIEIPISCFHSCRRQDKSRYSRCYG